MDNNGVDSFMIGLLQRRFAPVQVNLYVPWFSRVMCHWQIVFWAGGTALAAPLGMEDSIDYYIAGDGTMPGSLPPAVCGPVMSRGRLRAVIVF